MKSTPHKIAATCMAFIVLMTTMSFTVSMHYCGKMLVDYSVFNGAKTCSMDNMEASLNCEMIPSVKKICCTDKQLIVEGQDDLKISLDNLDFEQFVFISAFSYSYISLFEEQTSLAITLKGYPPPIPKRNVQVLHQTFLI